MLGFTVTTTITVTIFIRMALKKPSMRPPHQKRDAGWTLKGKLSSMLICKQRGQTIQSQEVNKLTGFNRLAGKGVNLLALWTNHFINLVISFSTLQFKTHEKVLIFRTAKVAHFTTLGASSWCHPKSEFSNSSVCCDFDRWNFLYALAPAM